MLKLYKRFASSATFSLKPYKLFKLDSGPASEATCNKEDGLKYYREMQTIRRMETAAGNLYKEKAIRGFCHLYSGQEAVAVGIEASLQPQDSIITAYRCHGYTYTRGGSLRSIFAELQGKSTGVAKGKGGSMHMYGRNFYGGNGIVGAQVPIGTGVAWAHKFRQDNGLCVSLFGDGAANQGQVYEAFNIAKLWDLPCIFICENNKFGMGTDVHRASANTSYYTRGDYIPGVYVDGMDILTVRESLKFASEWCRSGKGPILLETETYRYHGHSMSDPGTSYRTRDDVQKVRKERDPINQFVLLLTEAGLVTKEEIQNIDAEIKKEIEDALNESRKDVEPTNSELYSNVYSQIPQNFRIRGPDISIVHNAS